MSSYVVPVASVNPAEFCLRPGVSSIVGQVGVLGVVEVLGVVGVVGILEVCGVLGVCSKRLTNADLHVSFGFDLRELISY